MDLLRFLARLVIVPVKLVLAALGVTFRTGRRVGAVPARLTGRTVRLVGVRGWVFFLLGLAVGLAFAPGPGRELRARLAKLLSAPALGDGELAAKVTYELAHAPRTWHLPQPSVTVHDGTVTLSGEVADHDARAELGRVASAIPGVGAVVNHLTVPAAPGDEAASGAEPAAD